MITLTQYKRLYSFKSKAKYLLGGSKEVYCTVCRCFSEDYTGKELSEIAGRFRRVMRNVPQPVVVVTTSQYNVSSDTWLKRGVTCSSFTSISLQPSIISFTMNRPSRMHNLMLETEKFAVHVLARNQVGYGLHFAKPAIEGQDQFEHIPHDQNSEGIPIIPDVSAVLACNFHSFNTIGDHHVWYGEVKDASMNEAAQEPMLYYMKSVGDETFLMAFEDRTLPFDQWTHEAHLRMAWNYIKEHGKEKAIPLIRNGIQQFNEVNKDKISRGYNETVTIFYIHIIADAITKSDHNEQNFEDFISHNKHIEAKDLLFKYYSPEVIQNKASATRFVEPDRAALPGT